MNSEIGKLGKHTMIYGIGIVAGKAASFIMLPIYTRYLTPRDYGILELLITTIDIIAMIAAVGLTGAVFKFYSQYDEPEDKKEVISTVVVMMMSMTAITAMVGLGISPLMSRLVFGDAEYAGYFRLLFAIYFLQSGIAVIPLIFIRAMQDSTRFVVINLCKLAIQVGLNIYFLVIVKLGVTGVLYSALLAEFLIGAYLIYHTLQRVGFRFSLSKCREMIRFGYPFIFVSLGGFLLTSSDRYILNAFSDLEAVGLYALAYKFGFILSTVAFMPFNLVWESQRFEIAKREGAQLIFKKVFFYCNLLIVTLSLLICLFVRDFLAVMSDASYLAAYKIVPIIIIIYIVQIWASFCNLGLYLKGRSRYMATSALTAAAVAVVLNLILVPRYGAYGAGLATAGACFVRFILVYRLSQALYPIDYGWGKQTLVLAVAGGIYLVGRVGEMGSLTGSLIVNMALMAVFVLIAYRFFLEKEERSVIRPKNLWATMHRVIGTPRPFRGTVGL